jgi:heme ABC exporter ATP-binding subunit CcmA
MLSVREISAGYGEGDVIKNVTFYVKGGEVYVLLGPNGAGKTTTFRVIAGILPPSSGKVELLGSNIWENAETRRRMGYLPEGDKIYPQLSVRKNLLFFSKLYGVGEERLNDVMRKLDLLKYEGRPAGTLSAGYRKRVALARALIHDPQLLILDEPFANLDLNTVIWLRDFISSLLEEGRGVLLSSHIMGEIQHLEAFPCNVGIILNGMLRKEVPIGDLMRAIGGVDVLVRVDDMDKAVEVLSKKFSVRKGRTGIIVRINSYEDAPDIASALSSAGIRVYEIRTVDLPIEIFLKRTFAEA